MRFTLADWYAFANEENVRQVRHEQPRWLPGLAAGSVEVLRLDASSTEHDEACGLVADILKELGLALDVQQAIDPALRTAVSETGQPDAVDARVINAYYDRRTDNGFLPPGTPQPLDSPLPKVLVSSRPYVDLAPGIRKKASEHPIQGYTIIPMGALEGHVDENRNRVRHELGHLLGFTRQHHDELIERRIEDGMLTTTRRPYVIDSEGDVACVMRAELPRESSTYCGRCLQSMENAQRNIFHLYDEGMLGRQ